MAPLNFTPLVLLLFLSLVATISPASSLTCTSQSLPSNKLYQHCTDLSSLTSYLHWTYTPSNKTLSIAFFSKPPSPNGWVAWGLNPTSTGMVGTQSLIAYKESNGSIIVKTYDIASYSKLNEGKLSFNVYDKSAEFSDGMMKVFATVEVPESVVGGKAHHVWQVGPSVTKGVPDKHEFLPANLNSKGTIDLANGGGVAVDAGGGSTAGRLKKKNIHGILNAVSWGILFPLGVIIARYLRTFESADPAWFYLHAFCQVAGYAIGVAGWATGLKLGAESKGIVYSAHRNIGIALFSLATLQIFALFLRPKKDHKYRFYWNIYHHSLGYSIIILGIINIFKGLDILQPEKMWKSAYVIAIIVIGGVALILEAITWVIVLRRKNRESNKPYA